MIWFDASALECSDALPDDVEVAAELAVDVLYHLTGRRWPGVVSDSVTLDCAWAVPCSCDRATVRNGRDAGCWCGCGLGQRIRLPGFPVTAVTSVVVDTAEDPPVTLAPSAYRVDDRRWLVRLDGEGWPCDGTARVVYTWGGVPPAGGLRAAELYACELAKSMNPACKSCRLPRYASSVSRQGVSQSFPSAQELVAAGQVGLLEVDQWVQAVLLGDKRRRGTVLDPQAWPNRHRRP